MPDIQSVGYKMRTHLAKSLQTRCKTICRAVDSYNAAAVALTPPCPALDWSRVSHYSFIEEFALLKDTQNDIREKLWMKPVFRETLKLRKRIARTQEKVTCCNVETRRLHTSICDEDILFTQILLRLRASRDLMYGPVYDFIVQRQCTNQVLLKCIHQIQCLPGFTGEVS